MQCVQHLGRCGVSSLQDLNIDFRTVLVERVHKSMTWCQAASYTHLRLPIGYGTTLNKGSKVDNNLTLSCHPY